MSVFKDSEDISTRLGLEHASHPLAAATGTPETQAKAMTTKPLPDDALIIIPVRNLVLFPGVVLPVSLRRERSVAAAQEAMRLGKGIGLLLQKDAEVMDPTPDDLHPIGTSSLLLRYLTAPDGGHYAVCQGDGRFRIVEFLEGWPFLVAKVERVDVEDPETDTELEAKVHQLKQRAVEALTLLPNAPAELQSTVQAISSAGMLADTVAAFIDAKASEKQEVLETLPIARRLDRVLWLLAYRLEVLRLSRDIGQQTKETMESRQREYVLREQLKTIQKELGDADEAAEYAGLEQSLRDAHMPEDVEKQALKELRRLQRMSDASGEASMVRTYLEWLAELPWTITTETEIDIPKARTILDEDHYGLDRIKRRILEHLAVRKLNPEGRSPILCFVGPPGVGKTSLGQSIARATGRKFVRVSLGGVHDEAEIRGHRRTYIGALPGNIIQGIRRAGSRDCLMMLDEVDKLGSGIQGDPNAALLEVLDPEQNGTFRDNYLGVPFDLSRVMFIATANVLDSIPGPLRDRMEIIDLTGYTEEEKLAIAKRYLVPKQRQANGLTPEQCEVTDDALREVIGDYTREAGVRTLERQIGSLYRRVAMQIASGEETARRIDAGDVPSILGPQRFEREAAARQSVAGVVTGLAWTPVGGDILFVEAAKMSGGGRLILTGQLGEVMKESAQAALSVVKSRTAQLGLAPDAFEHTDIHIHVPAGAIPKDGPSAGVAMFMALVSLMTGKVVPRNVAMTGEISLRGLVLPVGGINEKLVAAARAGIETVLLPARNKNLLEEIPEEAKRKLTLIWVEDVAQAMEAAFGTLPAATETEAA
jgi:ATP-dependent Lon protease